MSDSGFNEGSGSHAENFSDTMSMDSVMSSASTSTLTGPEPFDSDPHTQLPGFDHMPPPSLDSGNGSSLSHSARSGQTAIPHGNNVEEMSLDSGISSGRNGSIDTRIDTERVDTQSRTEKWIQDQERSLMAPPSLDSGRGSSLSGSARSGQTAIPHGPGASGPHTQLPGFGQMSPPGLDSGRGSSLSHSARSGQTTIPHGNNVEEMSLDSGISSGRNGSLDTRMDTSNLLTERVDTQSRTVKRVQESQFDVFVVNLDGKTHTVTVDENEDVRSFKQKVAQKLGVPDAQQRLTTQAGKTLIEGQTLKASNVKKHSTIYCQGRLRGGSMTIP